MSTNTEPDTEARPCDDCSLAVYDDGNGNVCDDEARDIEHECDPPAVCDHDDTAHDIYFGTRCLDCGADLDADGPADDTWIARAYESAADAVAHRRAHDPHAALAADYARGDR